MWDVNHLLDLWDALAGGIEDLVDDAERTARALVDEVGAANLVAYVTVGGFAGLAAFVAGR